jgi:hypothetical protein
MPKPENCISTVCHGRLSRGHHNPQREKGPRARATADSCQQTFPFQAALSLGSSLEGAFTLKLVKAVQQQQESSGCCEPLSNGFVGNQVCYICLLKFADVLRSRLETRKSNGEDGLEIRPMPVATEPKPSTGVTVPSEMLGAAHEAGTCGNASDR